VWKLFLCFVPATILSILGVLETWAYLRVKKVWDRLPVVAATIEYSRLIDHTDTDGKREIGAIIRYTYQFRGKRYECNTPVLKGYDLFPSREFYINLVKENRPGELVNARVLPHMPEMAFLVVSPLSKVSMVLAPIISVGTIVFSIGYFVGLGTMIQSLVESW